MHESRFLQAFGLTKEQGVGGYRLKNFLATQETVQRHQKYLFRGILFFVPQWSDSDPELLLKVLNHLFTDQPFLTFNHYGLPFTYRCFMNKLEEEHMDAHYRELLVIHFSGVAQR